MRIITQCLNSSYYFILSMTKAKIAISLDEPLLRQIDSHVDGSIIRSRSQAIEYFLQKGLQEQSIKTVVLLLKGEHQHTSLSSLHKRSLILEQLHFFYSHGIKQAYIVTQHTKESVKLYSEVQQSILPAEIIEAPVKGNAQALLAVKDKLSNQDFIVMSGDVYNHFDLHQMEKKHMQQDKLATIGLMSINEPSRFGNAILDGDLIIDFQEKPKHISSHVGNAGIYLLKPEVFALFDEHTTSLENQLFPKIAKIKQLVGFFTHGEYVHAA